MNASDVSEFVMSGRIIDLVLVLVIAEAVVLIAYRRATGRGLRALDTLSTLASGACLMIGLRLALTHASWTLIVSALCAALLAHLYDLHRRWRGRPVVTA